MVVRPSLDERLSKLNSNDPNCEWTLTAYHEAGHAVVGYGLGGSVQSIQLGGEADDDLPERFGDCRVAWGQPGEIPDLWQRELMTVLAGPVAEMIYTGEPYHPALYGPWQGDWQTAWEMCSLRVKLARQAKGEPRDTVASLVDQAKMRVLESILLQLREHMQKEPIWPAVGAVADELLAHEYLEQEELHDTLDFWFSR